MDVSRLDDLTTLVRDVVEDFHPTHGHQVSEIICGEPVVFVNDGVTSEAVPMVDFRALVVAHPGRAQAWTPEAVTKLR